MIDDIFCKIINKEVPADIIMETDEWMAFKDIRPQAPVHILIVPKKHIQDISFAKEEDRELIGKLIIAANEVADKLKLDKGFRLILNQGEHGGPLVPHLHVHLLGGKYLGAKIVADTN